LAGIGGHGYGAKVATCTAINHLNRFTGVICLDGGPLDHRYYEAYYELVKYIEVAKSLNLNKISNIGDAAKYLDQNISCPKYRSIFKNNLSVEKGPLQWKMNLDGLYKNTRKFMPEVAIWSESYGLWPGNALILFPRHSRWVFLNTNTLPMYNVFPRL